jgi:hypothetical protein
MAGPGGAFPPMLDGLGGDPEQIPDLAQCPAALGESLVEAIVKIIVHHSFL